MLRRVAGCATPSGYAGHAGETAHLKLIFHLDHSAGADQHGSLLGVAAEHAPCCARSAIPVLGRFINPLGGALAPVPSRVHVSQPEGQRSLKNRLQCTKLMVRHLGKAG
jgi:hypothetical protein